MSRRRIGCLLLVAALISAVAEPVAAGCTMESQMQSAAQAEQTRRVNAINANMQTLTLLNQLQTMCLQGFQFIPTQHIPDSVPVMVILNQIEQAACSSLTNKARSTAQSAMAAAQAQVQQQIDNITSSLGKSTGTTGLLSNTMPSSTSSTSSTSSSGSGWSSFMNSMSRMFR